MVPLIFVLIWYTVINLQVEAFMQIVDVYIFVPFVTIYQELSLVSPYCKSCFQC